MAISPMVTFFTGYDYWALHLVNAKTGSCGKCQFYSGVGVLTGDLLQGMFPYLRVVDDNTIKCNNHPNCKCYLARVLLPYDNPITPDPEVVLAQSHQLFEDYVAGSY